MPNGLSTNGRSGYIRREREHESAFGSYTREPTGRAAQARSRRQLRGVTGAAERLRGLGDVARADYGRTYQPAIRRGLQLAEVGPERAVGEAGLDVGLAYETSLGAMQRNLSRMGIDPSSGRYQGMLQEWARARAASVAGAKTRARQTSRQQDFGRLMDVARTGAGGLREAGGFYGQAGRTRMGLAGAYGDIAYGEAEVGGLRREREDRQWEESQRLAEQGLPNPMGIQPTLRFNTAEEAQSYFTGGY